MENGEKRWRKIEIAHEARNTAKQKRLYQQNLGIIYYPRDKSDKNYKNTNNRNEHAGALCPLPAARYPPFVAKTQSKTANGNGNIARTGAAVAAGQQPGAALPAQSDNIALG